MEDENGKRNGFEPTGDVIGKRLRTTEAPGGSVGTQEEDDREMASWLMLDEDSAMELSNLLDSWDAPPPPMKVRFIENPYSSTVIFQSSSAYVTINGNEETCGSSFSDSESSVMASIDLGGIRRVVLGEMKEEGGGAYITDACENGMDTDRDLEVEGYLVKEIQQCYMYTHPLTQCPTPPSHEGGPTNILLCVGPPPCEGGVRDCVGDCVQVALFKEIQQCYMYTHPLTQCPTPPSHEGGPTNILLCVGPPPCEGGVRDCVGDCVQVAVIALEVHLMIRWIMKKPRG